MVVGDKEYTSCSPQLHATAFPNPPSPVLPSLSPVLPTSTPPFLVLIIKTTVFKYFYEMK